MLLAACAGAPPSAPAPAPAPTQAMIKLYESPCYFPTCISYEIEVRPDGAYVLNGLKNTRTEGVTKGSFGPGAFEKAEAAFAAAGFATMGETLTSSTLSRPGGVPCINDLPAVEFTRRDANGGEKKVAYNTGCAVPEARKLLEDLRQVFRYAELVRKP